MVDVLTDVRVDALVALAVLVAAHVAGRRLTVLDSRLGVRFAQAAEGCLLAYVVVDLLPTVAEAEVELEAGALAGWPLAEPAWLACLAGMLLLAMAETPARRRARAGAQTGDGTGGGAGAASPVVADREGDGEAAGVDAAFLLVLVAHSAANVNIGVLLLHHHRDGVLGMAAVTSVLAVHLALTEREHTLRHGRSHARWGRPVLIAALVAGGTLGAVWQPGGTALALLRAALAGLLVLNVFQHHVRQDDVARAPAFLAGGVAYGLALTVA